MRPFLSAGAFIARVFTTTVISAGVVPLLFSACGVKGKPLPPLQPAEIGRGAPTYKRTAEEAKPVYIPPPNPSPVPSNRRNGP